MLTAPFGPLPPMGVCCRLWLCCLLCCAVQIRMAQEVANFFVAEARRNLHRSHSIVDEDTMLIYNFK